MTVLAIDTARVFKPLLQPSRYKGAWGGRSSGKSHFFAEAAVERCILRPGTRGLCVREVQKDLRESAKKLIEGKIESLGVTSMFDIQRAEIRTPGGGVLTFSGMQDHTAESIKSYEGYDFAWVEEAAKLSERSLRMLRPTIRTEGSELWFNWNPLRKSDPVDKLLRGPNPPPGAVVVKATWQDNPWFPKEMEDERAYDEMHHQHTYGNVWEGEYAGVQEGAYFTVQLLAAKKQERIGRQVADPMLQYRTFWDLGVGDATAIWVAQFAGREVRVLDYIEGQGQPLSYYVSELRERGYDQALCVLPHDGAHRDSVQAIKFEDHLRDAGFKVQTISNQGMGAARLRIEAARRLFPRIWFDGEKCAAGLEALGAYHERKDEDRGIGLGPEHDWSSHGADAFGLMCVAYDPPKTKIAPASRVYTTQGDDEGTRWMRS